MGTSAVINMHSIGCILMLCVFDNYENKIDDALVGQERTALEDIKMNTEEIAGEI